MTMEQEVTIPVDEDYKRKLRDKRTYTSEVIDFCDRRGVTSLLENAIQLAEKHFATDRLSVCLGGDPESDEEWVVLQADVSTTVEGTLASYRGLKKEWLKTAPLERSSLVRFVYN